MFQKVPVYDQYHLMGTQCDNGISADIRNQWQSANPSGYDKDGNGSKNSTWINTVII